jgi:nucleoid DNA-binding protein
MKRSDLARSIQVRFQRLRPQDASAMLDTIVKSITDSVANGDRIEIRGFGTWLPRTRSAKKTINPRTGQPMTVGAGRTILFRPSAEMIKEMNN